MSRESGYYWVKLDKKSNWEIAVFTYQWELKGGTLPHDADLYKINPTRILTPDEQEEKELNEALQSKADMAHQEYLDDC